MALESETENGHGLTTSRTLRRGEPGGQGTDGIYYGLASGPGEPHLRRLDLAPGVPPAGRHASLLQFVYITDIHVLDAASPGRFEFADRFYGPAPLHVLTPAYRPQEILQLHAVEAMLRTTNAIAASPITGAPVRFLLCTGDYTDNAQFNELRWAATLLQGGTITPGSGMAKAQAAGSADIQGLGERPYEGVASAGWGDPAYWHPDQYVDEYKRRWGFPTHPGLLDDAYRPFTARGVARPWLTLGGNHDALIQGTARSNPTFERMLTGDRKARAFPEGFDLLGSLDSYIARPESFLSGPTTAVRSDPSRRTYSRREFVQAFLDADGAPIGHGFSAANLDGGTGYYVVDAYTPLRLIALDTVNRGGHYEGSVGAAQLAWLEERLSEVHARYWDARGHAVESGHEDRLVVILSHHPLATLVNDLAAPDGSNDLPRILGPEVEQMLHRFPNVILWVNGHTHRNAVRPHPDPAGRTVGFWEVTTSSLLDWPCQARLVEIAANNDDTLSIFCTMVDHAAPADPAAAESVWRLAALHRELAANDPHAGIAAGGGGDATDRNVELVLPAPFPLTDPRA